jgi:hypothetical protein
MLCLFLVGKLESIKNIPNPHEILGQDLRYVEKDYKKRENVNNHDKT